MKNIKNFVALIFLAVFMSVSGLVGAQNAAQQGPGNGFQVSPVRVELSVEKGSTQNIDLNIENPTNSKIVADVIINDFEANPDESAEPRVLFDPNTSTSSNSFKSIASSQKTIELAPKGKAKLKVTISVPKDGYSGGYYGVVRVAPQISSSKNVTVAASVGTLFLVEVPGDLKEELNFVEMTAAKNGDKGRIFINSGSMSIISRLQNTGNIHVKPFGKVKITDRSGKLIEEFEFNSREPRSNVLPKSIRKFDNKLKNDKWFGKYTINASIGYGSSGGLIVAKNTFWVIPLWFVITVVAIIAILVIGGYILYKRYTNSKTKHRVNVRR